LVRTVETFVTAQQAGVIGQTEKWSAEQESLQGQFEVCPIMLFEVVVQMLVLLDLEIFLFVIAVLSPKDRKFHLELKLAVFGLLMVQKCHPELVFVESESLAVRKFQSMVGSAESELLAVRTFRPEMVGSQLFIVQKEEWSESVSTCRKIHLMKARLFMFERHRTYLAVLLAGSKLTQRLLRLNQIMCSQLELDLADFRK
jgi:hypothetical protein